MFTLHYLFTIYFTSFEFYKSTNRRILIEGFHCSHFCGQVQKKFLNVKGFQFAWEKTPLFCLQTWLKSLYWENLHQIKMCWKIWICFVLDWQASHTCEMFIVLQREHESRQSRTIGGRYINIKNKINNIINNILKFVLNVFRLEILQ